MLSKLKKTQESFAIDYFQDEAGDLKAFFVDELGQPIRILNESELAIVEAGEEPRPIAPLEVNKKSKKSNAKKSDDDKLSWKEKRQKRKEEKEKLQAEQEALEKQEQLREEMHSSKLTTITQAIAPDNIDFTNPDYLVIDGLFCKTLIITGYPEDVTGAWASNLVGLGDGIDTSIRFLPIDDEALRLKNAASMKTSTIAESGRKESSQDYSSIINKKKGIEYIKEGVNTYSEKAYYVLITISIYASTKEEMEYKTRQVHRLVRQQGFEADDAKFLQQEAYLTGLPCGPIKDSILSLGKRNVLSADLAASFPFTSPEMCEETGVFLGMNDNGSLVILDPFSTERRSNGNMFFCGTTGAGKTYALQLTNLRLRQQQTRCFIIAHMKAEEYKRACDAVGGKYVRLMPGTNERINIMDIKPIQSESSKILYGDNPVSLLSLKIEDIVIFLKLVIEDITFEEISAVKEVILATYAEKGITEDNESLLDPNKNDGSFREMPILADLQRNIKRTNATKRMAARLEDYVTGSANYLNGQTTVDLTEKYIVFDLSEIRGDAEILANYICFSMLMDELKRDKTIKTAITIDELWYALSNEGIAKYVEESWRTIRGLGGIAIGATQMLSDTMKINNGQYGHAIIANSAMKFLMRAETVEAEILADALHLSMEETILLTTLPKGQAILYVSNDHIKMRFVASPLEHQMITTDPSDHRKMVEEYKDKKILY